MVDPRREPAVKAGLDLAGVSRAATAQPAPGSPRQRGAWLSGRGCHDDIPSSPVPTVLDPEPVEAVEFLPGLAGWVGERVRASGSDLTVLQALIVCDPVGRRVLIDQAVDLRRSLLGDSVHVDQLLTGLLAAEQALLDGHRPCHEGTQDPSVVVGAATSGAAAMVGGLDAAARALGPLAQSLVDEPDLPATAHLSGQACRRHLVSARRAAGELADPLATPTRSPWATEVTVDPSGATAGP